MSVKFLTRSRELVHNKIINEINSNSLIEEAMRYSALSDSKVIRPALVMASGELNNNLTKHLRLMIQKLHTLESWYLF